MRQQDHRDIWKIAVVVLKPRQWEAFWLRYVDELTYREIGERMGIGERAAARLVDRALRRIGQHVERGTKSKEPARTVQADGPMAA